MNRPRLLTGVAVAWFLTAGCRIDFNADVPCDTNAECPSGYYCDQQFYRCVEGEAVDAGDDTDTVDDVPGRDVDNDTPVRDTTDDVPADGSGQDVSPDVDPDTDVDAGDAPDGDVPTDGSGDAGCVPTGPEVCDEIDNDCNGTVDDPPVCDGPCATGMVAVEREGDTFCIDQYEASRADATAESPGVDATIATSRAGVIPWSVVSLEQASSACTAAGKRLCSAFEWQTSCQGESLALYPYGNSYQGSACNGSNASPLDGPAPTGQFSDCVSDDDVFDLSGNLTEWTADGIVRGGGFADPQLNLRCSSRASDPGTPQPSFGFRCCTDP